MIWKDVKGFEGLYIVSDTGIVYSKTSNRNLRPVKKRDGYLQVTLANNGKLKYARVHRITKNNQGGIAMIFGLWQCRLFLFWHKSVTLLTFCISIYADRIMA